jgi:hypothetical protein
MARLDTLLDILDDQLDDILSEIVQAVNVPPKTRALAERALAQLNMASPVGPALGRSDMPETSRSG